MLCGVGEKKQFGYLIGCVLAQKWRLCENYVHAYEIAQFDFVLG